MAKVLQRVEITLRSFYIFNSRFGEKEGEVSEIEMHGEPPTNFIVQSVGA